MDGMDRDRPNILLIVWDACRYDYAVEHASYLNELASSNFWFEKAIAPSPWSLPSHASIFTGKYPHEHSGRGFGDPIETPLVGELSDLGYRCYGISANSFASQRCGFHEDFDRFRYTGGRDLYTEGMDVSGTSQGILRDEGGSHKDALMEVLRRIPRHDHRLKSFMNLVSVGCGELATKFDALQKIPHPTFAPTSDYSYSPEKNTRVLKSMLADHDTDEPFFVFMNYMDTHRCYKPSKELQEKHIGRSLGYGELVRLNEEVAAPWAYEERKTNDELYEEDVEDVRGLYAGEVETVDAHLERVCSFLEQEDMLEDTLVVVTSDHGENLGEVDEMGRQRMGHEASVSEAVLRVPMLLAHPNLPDTTFEQPISLKDLYGLFLDGLPELLETESTEMETVSELFTDNSVVAAHYPATGGGDETLEKYPDAPEDAVRHRASENSAVAYDEDWKVVAESTDERWAGDSEGERRYSDAPEELVEVCEDDLRSLCEAYEEVELSEEDVSQLEALGYL